MTEDHGSGLAPDDPAYAGQRDYTAGFLRVYDPLVLGLYGRAVWRCPPARLGRHYAEHLRRRHMDVGPGTGRFLARAPLAPDAHITLVDPNPNVLAYTARRLRGRDVTLVQADVCKPLPAFEERFESVGLNLVLHCLPSDCEHAAIWHLAGVLEPEGVMFGSTVSGRRPSTRPSHARRYARSTAAGPSTTRARPARDCSGCWPTASRRCVWRPTGASPCSPRPGPREGCNARPGARGEDGLCPSAGADLDVGAPPGTRTPNLPVKSRMLCQLS